MTALRVAVLGGGPGGIYAARLIKLARPGWDVTVHEEHPADRTFGFGVGFSATTQSTLARADPATWRDVLGAAHRGHGMELASGTGSVVLASRDQVAVARSRLLQILHRHAHDAGVRTVVGGRADAADLDADVVIAADGANSATRQARPDLFGATSQRGRQMYLWCGTDFPLQDALFQAVRSPQGVFTTHAYPYASDRSTFLVETDEDTWRAAGFDGTSDGLAPGQSDETSLAHLQDLFAGPLRGRPLLGNHSRWARFRTVRCARWHSGRTVLLGDAAHTAHYSIGSGTKLAMEDAISLAASLDAHPHDPTAAFERYQHERLPAVERLQHLADRSQLWWEAYTRRLHLPAEQLLLSFLTRAGNVAVEEFAATEPGAARRALAAYAGVEPPAGASADLNDWIVRQPLRRGCRSSPDRYEQDSDDMVEVAVQIADPWSEEADAFVRRCRELLHDGAEGVALAGPDDRSSLLQRLDIAERLRLDLGATTAVRGPRALLPDLAAGLAAARTDLVGVR